MSPSAHVRAKRGQARSRTSNSPTTFASPNARSPFAARAGEGTRPWFDGILEQLMHFAFYKNACVHKNDVIFSKKSRR